MLKDNSDISQLTTANIMSKSPKKTQVEALEIMGNNNITQILVKENTTYVGAVHLHYLLKEGLF